MQDENKKNGNSLILQEINKDENTRTTVRQEKILDTCQTFMYDNQGDVMESIIKQSLLYDFYGELLTEHQRTVYEDAVFNDMSLGEIAEEQGISRQGVHDLIKRCDKILSGYEEKLHLVQKFQQTRQMVEDIQERTRAFHETKDESLIAQIEQISSNILEL